jgi:hypothetical protein
LEQLLHTHNHRLAPTSNSMFLALKTARFFGGRNGGADALTALPFFCLFISICWFKD